MALQVSTLPIDRLTFGSPLQIGYLAAIPAPFTPPLPSAFDIHRQSTTKNYLMSKTKKLNHTLFLYFSIAFALACSTSLLTASTGFFHQASAFQPSQKPAAKGDDRNNLYDSLHLDSLGLTRSAFSQGLSGLDMLIAAGDIRNADILSIVDLNLPSSKKRLFVIDVSTRTLVYNTYVSHGRNSGREMATQFSNQPNSYESSLGFYVTGDTYIGHHGYSLKLDGKEEGINDNAFSRGIVMHSASYVNERMATARGYIGRSEGCPAIPVKWHKNLIEKIKNGTCLFFYSADKFYAAHTKMRFPPIS